MNVTTKSKVNVLIPMAGVGRRFTDAGYTLPKLLLPLGGKTMIEAVVANLTNPNFNFIFVINNEQLNPKEILNLLPNVTIVEVAGVPQGPAMSCMCASALINNDEKLIITNCDQIIEDFSYEALANFSDFNRVDGVLGTFHSASPKNSYMKVNDDNEVIEVREKQVISNLATNGLHYWTRGKYFVESVGQMIGNRDMVNNEYYVAPSYNYMIKRGMKVMPFWYNMHFPIGIPQDYENYKRDRNL